MPCVFGCRCPGHIFRRLRIVVTVEFAMMNSRMGLISEKSATPPQYAVDVLQARYPANGSGRRQAIASSLPPAYSTDAFARYGIPIAVQSAQSALLEIMIGFRAAIHLTAFPFGSTTGSAVCA